MMIESMALIWLFVTALAISCISAEVRVCLNEKWIPGSTGCFYDAEWKVIGHPSSTFVEKYYEFCKGLDPRAKPVVPTNEEENNDLIKFVKKITGGSQVFFLGIGRGSDWDEVWRAGNSLSDPPITWFPPSTPLSQFTFGTRCVALHENGKSDSYEVDGKRVPYPDYAWRESRCTNGYRSICKMPFEQKEWGCFDDRKRLVKNPSEKEAMGCRSSLTCSSINRKDGTLTSGMTVNIRRGYHGAVARADVDVIVEKDMPAVIAFTEGTSPRQGECVAEKLGLFLPHSSVGMNGRKLDNSIIGEANLKAGIKTTFCIENLQGVTSLVGLAGRGLVVCPSDKVDVVEGRKRCLSDAIPLCCKLSWVLEEDQQWLDDYIFRNRNFVR